MSEAVMNTHMLDIDNDKPSFIRGKGVFTIAGLVGGLGLWGYLTLASGEVHKHVLNSYIRLFRSDFAP
jgi:hypothetical protein